MKRQRLQQTLKALLAGEQSAATELLPASSWHVAHPINELTGAGAIMDGFYAPLRHAIERPMRRDDILIGGTSRTGSGDWIAAMGHYTGLFKRPLWGISPTGRLAFLRYGEFYRIEHGRIAEARILLDLIDLMRQAGCMPLPAKLGAEMLFPAPATHDGVCPNVPGRSAASAALVEAMLGDLRDYDPADFSSKGQTGKGGYWHEDMLWYGPGGIGSTQTYPGFDAHHRVAFLTGFPDRVGGNHYARFGDGDYVASGGWPSLTGTHAGPYLDVPATNRKISMRVMDFWRCQDGQIMENWVFIDMPDLFLQMGVDLFDRVRHIE